MATEAVALHGVLKLARRRRTLKLYTAAEMWELFSMRPGVFIATLLLTGAALRADDVAKMLQTRNTDLAPTLFQNKTFGTSGTFNGTGRAFVKDFYFIDRFRPRAFDTRTFFGSKDHWAGDFKFKTDAANTNSGKIIVNATKAVDTKTSETKAANESTKESATRTYANSSEYRGRGKSQDRFDRDGPKAQGDPTIGLQGNMHPLTIEEVRELLNKNK
jgi:hypothetical protein